jgi:hypothetical protein
VLAALRHRHELETATLHAALEAAESLPQSAWLNLNSSPELILAGEPLRTLLGGSRRLIVAWWTATPIRREARRSV